MYSGGFAHQYDATTVGADGDPERTVVERPIPQNRPGGERVPSQERTVIWSQEEQIDLNRVAVRLASYGSELRSRGQFFAAVGIAAVLIVGILVAVFEENSAPGKLGSLTVQIPIPEPKFIPSTLSRPAMYKPSPVDPVAMADSNMAADALIDGRLDQAMAYFRALKERYPENEPYGLIVDILAASQGTGVP